MAGKIRISDEICLAIALDYIQFDESKEELKKIYGVSSVKQQVDRAIKSGFIREEDYREAIKRRRSQLRTGRKHTEEVKAKISEGHLAINPNEINSLCLDYCFFDDNPDNIAERYGIEKTRINRYLEQGIKRGFISSENKQKAIERRYGKVRGLKIVSDKALEEIVGQIKQEVELYNKGELAHLTTNTEFGKKYGVSLGAIRARLARLNYDFINYRNEQVRLICQRASGESARDNKTGIHALSLDDFAEIGRRSGTNNAKNHVGLFARSQEEIETSSRKGGEAARDLGVGVAGLSFEQHSQNGIKGGISRAKNLENKKYSLNGQLYDSKSEAVTALMLEKYIPNFKLERGATFQANRDTHCVYDFVLPEAIVEWHPIQIRYDASPMERQAYRDLKSQLRTIEDRKAFRELSREYSEELAVQYWMERQEASDNSQVYQGKEVILARNAGELYNQVISRFGKNYPSRKEFTKQFESLKKKVQEVRKQEAA